MYYTYAYLREDRTPYYIGKGTENRAYTPHIRKNCADFKPKSKDQILILKKFENEEDAYKHEKYLIFLYGLKINGGLLINLTYGGDGGGQIKYSDEEREEAYRKKAKEYYRKNEKRIKESERVRRRKNLKINAARVKKYRERNKEKCLKREQSYREKKQRKN